MLIWIVMLVVFRVSHFDDIKSFVEISDIILNKIHLSEASKVISHITKTQFSAESKNDDL